MGLELIPAYGRQEEIMTLFTEYTDMLMEADPTVRQYLILQHYEKELERPESKRAACIWPIGTAVWRAASACGSWTRSAAS